MYTTNYFLNINSYKSFVKEQCVRWNAYEKKNCFDNARALIIVIFNNTIHKNQ